MGIQHYVADKWHNRGKVSGLLPFSKKHSFEEEADSIIKNPEDAGFENIIHDDMEVSESEKKPLRKRIWHSIKKHLPFVHSKETDKQCWSTIDDTSSEIEDTKEKQDFVVHSESPVDLSVLGQKYIIKQIFIASYEGDVDKVRRYLPFAENAAVKDENGNTALHYAAGKGYVAIVQELMETGHYAPDALTTLKGSEGMTPADWAKNNGHNHIVTLSKVRAVGVPEIKIEEVSEAEIESWFEGIESEEDVRQFLRRIQENTTGIISTETLCDEIDGLIPEFAPEKFEGAPPEIPPFVMPDGTVPGRVIPEDIKQTLIGGGNVLPKPDFPVPPVPEEKGKKTAWKNLKLKKTLLPPLPTGDSLDQDVYDPEKTSSLIHYSDEAIETRKTVVAEKDKEAQQFREKIRGHHRGNVVFRKTVPLQELDGMEAFGGSFAEKVQKFENLSRQGSNGLG